MDTKKYEVFEKTVELSSLTKAAQELGLTQSGVSHMLSAIEAALQLPLLTRTPVKPSSCPTRCAMLTATLSPAQLSRRST